MELVNLIFLDITVETKDVLLFLKKLWPYFLGFISIIGLRIAYKNKKDQPKISYREKQREKVFSLIKELQTAKCEVVFTVTDGKGSSSGRSRAIKLNIFEIAQYDTIDDSNSNHNFNDEVVLFAKDSNQLANIKEYLIDPLVPKEIIKKLSPFYNSSFNDISMPNETENLRKYVLIISGIWENKEIAIPKGKGYLIEGDGLAFLTWENLKEHGKALKASIEIWLKEIGVDDYNINTDFIESTF